MSRAVSRFIPRLSCLSPLALAVSSVISAPAQAVTLFEGTKNSSYLTGFADILVTSQELNTRDQKVSDDGQMSSAATRFRFTFEHEVSNKLKVDLISEYFVNLVNGDFERSNLFVNRLGSVGFNAPNTWGEVRVGKQWSPFYSLVLGYIDGPIISDSDAAGIYNLTDGGLRGVGRLDKGAGYLKSWRGFTFGAQAGLKQNARGTTLDVDVGGGQIEAVTGDAERDWNYALAANYSFPFGLTIGAGWNQLRYDVKNGPYYGLTNDVKGDLAAIGLNYNWNNKLKIASSIIPYARYYHVTSYDGQGTRDERAELVRDSTAADIWVRYRFNNGLIPYLYLSYIDMDDICRSFEGAEGDFDNCKRDDSDRTTAYVGLMYFLSEQMSLSLGYDYTDFAKAVHRLEDNDRVGFKIRYWFDENTSGW